MEKRLFSITCTTCQARIAVRSVSAIGAIFECPKCQSMVQIIPPEGWVVPPPIVTDSVPDASQPPLPPPIPPPVKTAVVDSATAGPNVWADNKWLIVAAAAATVLTGIFAALLLSLMPAKPAASPPSTSTTAVKPPETAATDQASINAPPMTPPADAAKAPSETVETEASPMAANAVGTDTDVAQSELPSADSTPPVGIAETVAPPGDEANGQPNAVPAGKASRSEPPPPVEPPPPSSSPVNIATETTPDKSDTPAGGPVVENVAESGETAAVPEFKKLAPAPVDVDARLADPIPEIEITNMPLSKALDLVGAIGALPVTLDVDATASLGVTPRDAVSVRLTLTTVGDALRAVAGKRGLDVIVDSGHASITSPLEYREDPRKVRYVVSDLVDDAQTPIDALAAIIQQFVAPESWQGRQGQGTIEPDDGALTVVQPNAVQQQVLAFCERLRLARKKPLQSREDAARFSLTTRAAQGKEFLARPVTANFHEPTPLRQVLTYLVATNPSDATPCDILIDHIALAAAETSDRVDASVVAQATPLGDTLNELLRPLGLAYRIVDAHTLQVTTKDALDDRLELEFYPVGRLLTADWGSRVLTDEIKREVSPGSWSDTGGLGEIYFDAPSGCLLVLQSQPTQAAVAHFLAAKP